MKRRRLLVIAHDFPPVRSPQSVRAQELVSLLASSGWDVVLVTRRGDVGITKPWGFRVIRVSPGWFEALVARLSRRGASARSQNRSEAVSSSPSTAAGPSTLNWKGRIVQTARRVLASLLFPDATVLWVKHARHAIEDLFRTWPFDVALIMHEPASALCLADVLERISVPWVADLADPVLAPYTRPWWRERARRLEAASLGRARQVTVTNASTAALLRQRHPSISFKATVVRQGFATGIAGPLDGSEGPLRLLYTGRFYSFRRPDALLAAIGEVDDVVLTIAGPEMPDSVVQAAARMPDKVVLMGDLSYEDAKALQGRADVLVCVANADTVQVPGKFFEYLGAARPILHLKASEGDELQRILDELGRGEAVMNEPGGICAALRALRDAKRKGELATRYDLSLSAVHSYSWSASAATLGDVLLAALSQDASEKGPI